MGETLTVAVLVIVGLIGVVAVSGWLSLIDLRTHRLPNRIVGPLAAGVAVWLVVLGVAEGDLGRTVAAIGWGCLGCLVFFVLHLTAGLGMGDVKYAWPVTATLGWFGWGAIRIGLFALLISGAVAGAVVIARGHGGRHRVAYGPLMAVGLVVGAVYGVAA